jgi:hypothetical protein
MRVVLVRKLADWIDGIDLSGFHVGDVLELPRTAARLLAAEGWALADRRRSHTAPRLSGYTRRRADRGDLCDPSFVSRPG